MLGNIIRTQRKKMNVTLKELSEQVGITAGGLSQIERGEVDPSLAVLRRISRALQLPLYVMFSEESGSFISRNGKRQKANFCDTYSYEFLTPTQKTSGIEPKVEVVMVTLGAKTYGDDTLSAHEADECFVVLKGEIVVEMENENVHLFEGDSLYLTEGVRHRLYNPGDMDVIGLSILSAMIF